MILTYDGTINGFLTCIYYCYYEKLEPKAITCNNVQVSFDVQLKNITTENDKAEKVKKAVIQNGESFLNIEYAFSSYKDYKDLIIYNYLGMLFKYKSRLAGMLNNGDVIAFHSICYEVTRECQRIAGFLRFNETVDGIYYAKIEPDNNIVKFIMPHFVSRFGNQKFLIHDVKRNIVGIYDTVKSAVFKNNKKLDIHLSSNEEYIQSMFKTYYKTIAIKSRKNKKLMLGFMPHRYHKNMLETFEK